MGVTGLWRLVEPAGQPVPVETLENKVLAVDISIWLHQVVKGYQDAKGAPLPNAHLLGLFQRLCKLLYFRIKPVFVFDGGFPDLKKETIAKRQDNKSKYHSESERLKRELALLLTKKTAISSLLGKETSPKKISNISSSANNDDLFKLPALPEKTQETESESDTEDSSNSSIIDLHSIELESEKFKSLPIKEKYDLLVELKETRKMNSWGKLHELPKKSDNFSNFQMQRLLKRRKVQECLEETEKEMGGNALSLNELESLLNEEGIDTKIDSIPTRRIASDNTTRFLLINNVKQALAEAKKKKEIENRPGPSNETKHLSTISKEQNISDGFVKDELEEDLQKAIKMSMECMDESQTSLNVSKTDDSWTSCLSDSDNGSNDSENLNGFEESDMACAKAYIEQYSDFTHKAIHKIIVSKKTNTNKESTDCNVNKIFEEIQLEKSIIVDKVDNISSDECVTDINETADSNVSHETKSCDLENQPALAANVNTLQDFVGGEDKFKVGDVALDTSCNENRIDKSVENVVAISDKNTDSSELSDDDFEEVDEKPKTHVIELNLNMNMSLENDIFADVFEDNKIYSTTKHSQNDISINSSEEQINDNMNQDRNYKEDIKTSNEVSTIKTDLSFGEEVKHTNKNKIDGNTDITTVTKIEDVADKILADKPHEKVQSPTTIEKIISVENLNTAAESIGREEDNLLQEKARLDRIGRNITEQMTKETQELLQVFGIPYVVAPMEAEAQCAFLESINLTDGTITDDSDIWLFGGKTVYKNFFNQKKTVLQFLSEKIERSFNLTREQLILLALLVGSDYTTGVNGVGPVTALEILASFPLNKRKLATETSDQGRYIQIVDGLKEFKKWVRAGKRTDNTTLKKKLKNVQVADDFPSVRVVQAYLEPNVEKSKERFSWGDIDITVLREYTKAKFGWSQNKLDEIIKPVLNRMLDSKKQKSIQDYFKTKIEFGPLEHQMSTRVKAAVKKMGLDGSAAVQNGVAETKTAATKRKVKKNKTVTKTREGLGPSKAKQKKSEESIVASHAVKVISEVKDGKTDIEICIPKSDRMQEFIPQRERHKRTLLENKLKAIEIYRKSNIERKKKLTKRKPNLPKDKAELSESSDSG